MIKVDIVNEVSKIAEITKVKAELAVDAVFEAMRASMPAEQRNFADPFADAVPVHDDAPLIDRLVAWNGRQPC